MCRRTSIANSTTSVEERVEDIPLLKQSDDDDDQRSSTKNPTALQHARHNLDRGTLLACLSLLLLITGMSVTFPLLQSRRDELGCDSLCYGSMTSARSALGLVGTAVIGRLSDRNGSILARTLGALGKRGNASGSRACLDLGRIASLVGLIISILMNSLRGLWLSMIPGALLQHNFDIYKSLLSEFHNDIEHLETTQSKGDNSSEEDDKKEHNNNDTKSTSARSGSIGKLGMAAGISFMIGPTITAVVTPTFQAAIYFAILCTFASWFVIFHLPLPVQAKNNESKGNIEDDTKKQDKPPSEFTLMNMLKLKTHKAKAAMMLLVIRLNMALAFHIFNTVWPASLKARFDFGPRDHSMFMSFIGITYAFSQGFMAKRLVNMWGKNGKVYVIMLCCAVLGLGRYIAYYTSSKVIVYVSFLFIINALGTMNVVITADSGKIAPSDEVGYLFGILQAGESGAGMLGPFVGGLISHELGNDAPLVAVVGVYSFLFVFISWGYQRYVVSSSSESKKSV